MSWIVCVECGQLFNQTGHLTWYYDFCEDCLKKIHAEDERDGERDERGPE